MEPGNGSGIGHVGLRMIRKLQHDACVILARDLISRRTYQVLNTNTSTGPSGISIRSHFRNAKAERHLIPEWLFNNYHENTHLSTGFSANPVATTPSMTLFSIRYYQTSPSILGARLIFVDPQNDTAYNINNISNLILRRPAAGAARGKKGANE